MIDDDIRRALKVDPSPEFLVRVRTRVAKEPRPSAWRWSWSLAGVAALAAATVIAVVVSRPEPKTASTPDVVQAFPPPRVTNDAALRRGSPKLQGSEGGRPANQVPVVSGFSRTVPAALHEPEILIDPRERQALLRLITGVRQGRVDLSAAQNSTTTTLPELEPVTDIVIAPITIDLLAPLSGAEGVRP